MSALTREQHDRLNDLLADRALQGLSGAEAAECDALIARLAALPAGGDDPESIDRVVAALQVAMEPDDAQPMPAHLRRSVEARARREQNAPAPAIVGQIRPARSGGVSPWWVAAAAVIGVLVGGWPRGASTGAPSIAAVAGARDVVRASWQTAGELQSVQVSGEAVWSSERQAGYMRFAGLPVNDPAVEQYQLWIFDPSQPEATPIDGGVFNIASTGDVVVPIDPKLKVSGPTLFALTIEKPGGVVVSDRKRLVLVCKPT